MKPEHRFWDRFAKHYSRRPIADPDSYKLKLGMTREYLKPDMKVFEFGCGTGGTAIAHSPYVSDIHCIDASPNMIAIAKEQAHKQGIHNVKFDVDDFMDLPLDGNSYDVVLGLNVLHLMKGLEDVLQKVDSILAPNGKFIISAPCLGESAPVFRWIGPVATKMRLLPYLNVFTKQELEKSLTSVGFKIIHYWQPAKDKPVFIVAQKVSV